MTLGTNLKYLRLKNGYTQKYVAEQLKISSQTISKWENNWIYPDIDNLILLSELYHISLDVLLKTDLSQKNISCTYANPWGSSLLTIFSVLIISFISLLLPFWGLLFSLILLYFFNNYPLLVTLNKFFLICNLIHFCFFIVQLFYNAIAFNVFPDITV